MSILDSIFPKQCLLCTRVGTSICNSCVKRLSHTLPSCCICNKLSNRYYTHPNCNIIPFQCFTGWYYSKELLNKLCRQKHQHIYSTYELLINQLIEYHKIQNLVSNSNVYPIQAQNKDLNRTNIFISSYINKQNLSRKNTLFVGEYIDDIDSFITQLSTFKRTSLFALVLFDSILPQ